MPALSKKGNSRHAAMELKWVYSPQLTTQPKDRRPPDVFMSYFRFLLPKRPKRPNKAKADHPLPPTALRVLCCVLAVGWFVFFHAPG